MKGWKKTGIIKKKRERVRKFYEFIDELPDNKDKLYHICKQCGKGTSSVLKSAKFKFLRDWIEEQVSPFLSDSFYTLATKIHWILFGMSDFPRCLNDKCGHAKLIRKNVPSVFSSWPRYCNQTCINQSETHKKKLEQVSLQKYGTKHPMQCDIFKKKASDTYKARTGYDNPGKNPEVKERSWKTYKDRTGYDHNFKNPESLHRREMTWLKKYGETNPNRAQEIKDKVANTMKQLYGESCFFNTDLYNKYSRKTYKYDNFTFASMPELCFYIWLKDNDVKFEFQPKHKFLYIFNGKTHRYTADFYLIAENIFIDIKGDHFFEDHDPNKKMICPFNRSKDALYEAKHQCMKDNHIVILTSSCYVMFIHYVNDIYGKDFVEKFRTH